MGDKRINKTRTLIRITNNKDRALVYFYQTETATQPSISESILTVMSSILGYGLILDTRH